MWKLDKLLQQNVFWKTWRTKLVYFLNAKYKNWFSQGHLALKEMREFTCLQYKKRVRWKQKTSSHYIYNFFLLDLTNYTTDYRAIKLPFKRPRKPPKNRAGMIIQNWKSNFGTLNTVRCCRWNYAWFYPKYKNWIRYKGQTAVCTNSLDPFYIVHHYVKLGILGHIVLQTWKAMVCCPMLPVKWWMPSEHSPSTDILQSETLKSQNS